MCNVNLSLTLTLVNVRVYRKAISPGCAAPGRLSQNDRDKSDIKPSNLTQSFFGIFINIRRGAEDFIALNHFREDFPVLATYVLFRPI
jgi:hypothetical protein